MKVINLWAGPGGGKSTTAAGAFYHLKIQNKVKVELVTEHAKELCYRGVLSYTPQEQIIIEQFLRVKSLANQVDWVITDSPILLAAVYATEPWPKRLALDCFTQFDNINLLLTRSKSYQPYGRQQTEEEAKQKDVEVHQLLETHGLSYEVVDYNAAVNRILQIVEETHTHD